MEKELVATKEKSISEKSISEMRVVEQEIYYIRNNLREVEKLSIIMIETIEGYPVPQACTEERKAGETRFSEMKNLLRIDCNDDSLIVIKDNIQKVINMTKKE